MSDTYISEAPNPNEMNETALLHLGWFWVHVFEQCCSPEKNLCRQMLVLTLQGWNFLYNLFSEKQIQSTKQNVTNPTRAILNA